MKRMFSATKLAPPIAINMPVLPAPSRATLPLALSTPDSVSAQALLSISLSVTMMSLVIRSSSVVPSHAWTLLFSSLKVLTETKSAAAPAAQSSGSVRRDRMVCNGHEGEEGGIEHTYTYTQTYIYIYIYIYVHTHTYIYIYIYVYIYTHTHYVLLPR